MIKPNDDSTPYDEVVDNYTNQMRSIAPPIHEPIQTLVFIASITGMLGAYWQMIPQIRPQMRELLTEIMKE